MTIEELEYGIPSGTGRAAYDRTPPQDIAAEQSVLGGMMISKDAIADVIEQLRGNDFYRPAHEAIYDAVLDLYGRGEPADAVTVADELTKRGEMTRIGGAPYLHTLISMVPTAANAGYDARIVRERAVLRRLVEAGTRIVQLGYATDGGDVDEIVNNAQAEVYAVTERRASEDYHRLGDVIGGTVDEIEAAGHRGVGMIGIPTGFADLDRLTNGLHPGQMIVIAARPAIGKALALDTLLATPTGWTTMGDVRVGDELLAADGTPTEVVAATDVLTDRPFYRVTFDDGTTIVADAQHEWSTRTWAETERAREVGGVPAAPAIRTTEQLARALQPEDPRERTHHSIDTTTPLALPEAELPLPPYALGVWLGDGASVGWASIDPEIAMRVDGAQHGMAPCVVADTLRAMQLVDDAHIPTAYLRASQRQRRELLAGVLDIAGTLDPAGSPQITLTDRRLAEDVRELIHSLGYRTAYDERAVAGRRSVRVTFATDDDVFTLERKQLEHKVRRDASALVRQHRYVVAVEPVDPVPVRCVEIAHPSHLYLASESMIPTHNSTLGIDIARSASIKHNRTSVVFSLEMSRNEITMRLLSAEARIHLQKMRSGQMGEDDWQKLAATMGKISEAPLFIDDSPNMSLMEIRAKCRRLKQRHNLELVIIDYLQLMSSGKRVESRQQEVSEFSRALKLLAKELEVPVIAISQLNRGPEQRTDKRPMMSDLRESGCLTAETSILRADTGAETTMGELFALGARDVPVWALNERLQYVRRHLTHVFSTGTKPVFRLRLASGKEITATANHPFLTYEGWTPLGELAVGSRVGVPRHVPGPEQHAEWDDRRVVMLAHLLGADRTADGQLHRYASDIAGPTLTDGRATLVPTAVFHLPKRQIALFVRNLWSATGSVTIHPGGQSGSITYASTSRPLADGLSRLLLRFGISTRLSASRRSDGPDACTLQIVGRDDQRRFLQEIGVDGAHGLSAERLLSVVREVRAAAGVETGARRVWDDVRDLLADDAGADRQLVAVPAVSRVSAVPVPGSGAGLATTSSRQRLGELAELLGNDQLEIMAVNDLLWDEVVAIVPEGEQEVFDATVVGTHNFIANGVAVHNSIEQDADMVILLHRESMYERESPREGEADLIVAKHRNGPTDTITVAFQGHYSRFVDMQS